MSSDHTATRRLELFVRSLSAGPRNPGLVAILERIQALSAAGTVDDYAVHVVGRELSPETAVATDPGAFICERIVAFREWAGRYDLSLESLDEVRPVHSTLADETYETIVFPTAVLAEFQDGHVRAVAPCTDGDRRYAVADLLDHLEAAGRDDATARDGVADLLGEPPTGATPDQRRTDRDPPDRDRTEPHLP